MLQQRVVRFPAEGGDEALAGVRVADADGLDLDRRVEPGDPVVRGRGRGLAEARYHGGEHVP